MPERRTSVSAREGEDNAGVRAYPRRLQQPSKDRVNRGVGEWLPISSDKDVIRRGILPQTSSQVTLQPRQRSLVKYNETGFLELGLADQQPVRPREALHRCHEMTDTVCSEQQRWS